MAHHQKLAGHPDKHTNECKSTTNVLFVYDVPWCYLYNMRQRALCKNRVCFGRVSYRLESNSLVRATRIQSYWHPIVTTQQPLLNLSCDRDCGPVHWTGPAVVIGVHLLSRCCSNIYGTICWQLGTTNGTALGQRQGAHVVTILSWMSVTRDYQFLSPEHSILSSMGT